MKHLIVTPDRNTVRSDYAGAFRPESLAYQKFWRTKGHSVDSVAFDASLPLARRRFVVLDALGKSAYDSVAFFCHGWSSGLQAGFTKQNVHELSRAFTAKVTFALYACSTGADPKDSSKQAAGTANASAGNVGEGSFADALRDTVCANEVSCWVFAHTTAGHTTMNPNVVIFSGMAGEPLCSGGEMPVTKKNSAAWAAWVKSLKTTYRFEVPHLTVASIRQQFNTRLSG